MINIPTTWCVYCGDFNECQDHITPVCWTHTSRKACKTLTVDCCNMCNQLAGSFVAFNVTEKAGHLLNRYHYKYGDYQHATKWSLREISELSGMLKDYVAGKQFMAALITAKMHNVELVANGFAVTEPIRVYDTGAVRALTQVYLEADLERSRNYKSKRAALLESL